MSTLTITLLLIISFILGIIFIIAVELFIMWFLIFREDKHDKQIADYDEVGY